MKTIELNEVKELNPEMYGILTRHNDKIRSVISGLNKILPKDSQINEDCFFEIYTTEIDAFNNDGSTRTSGIEWEALWAFPVTGHDKKDFFKGSIEGGYCNPAIIFSLDNYIERLSDKNISGCKFFSLYFNYGPYSEIVNMIDREQVKSVRLDYQNDNYEELSIMKVQNYAKIIFCMKKLKETYDIIIKCEKI